jgi:HlyD family secretion protein
MAAVCAVIFVGAGSVFGAEGIAAITDPSADVMLSFLGSGRIAEVVVKEGNVVEKGSVLVRQDDSVEQIQLAQLRASSEDTNQILAAEATLAQKKIDLKRLEWALSRGAATDLEVEHARLDVQIAELSQKVTQFDHEQAVRKYEAAKISIDNLRLKSPVSGRVENVATEVGESVNALEDVIRVVRTVPLWIDAAVPLGTAKRCTNGEEVRVNYPDGAGESERGKIIFIATAADAASDTLRVRIEVPNKAKRPSGEHVTVYFGEGNDDQAKSEGGSGTVSQ